MRCNAIAIRVNVWCSWHELYTGPKQWILNSHTTCYYCVSFCSQMLISIILIHQEHWKSTLLFHTAAHHTNAHIVHRYFILVLGIMKESMHNHSWLVLCPRKFSGTVILHLAMSPKFRDRVDGRLCPRKFSGTVILHLAMSPKFGTVEGWICPEK